MKVDDVLMDELRAYECLKEELLKKYEGKVVVIKDGKLVGVYESEEEAFKDVVKRYGPVPVLIKRVVRKEEPVRMLACTYGLLTYHS